jgi:hypothetical protein
LPFTPTLTNFASRRAKETGPTEKFLEKHKFCPKTAHSVVQAWCKKEKRKMQVFENQALAFCWVPYDVLFSNEFLRDLSRLWELRDIVPDPSMLSFVLED